MNGLLEELKVDIFNLQSIECLEALGLLTPTQAQIDVVEQFLRRAGQESVGHKKFTKAFMLSVIDNSKQK